MKRQTPRQSGFTMVELAIATTILAVFVSTVAFVTVRVNGAITEGVVAAQTAETSARVLRRIVSEVQDAQLSSIVLGQQTDSPSISFATLNGWSGSAPTFSASKTIAISNGVVSVDNQTIAEGISGLTFNLDGAVLTIAVQVSQTHTIGGVERTVSRPLMAKVSL